MVDSADLARLEDCKAELHALLQEERLFGATLLIFANKQDVPSALPVEELEKVCWGRTKAKYEIQRYADLALRIPMVSLKNTCI